MKKLLLYILSLLFSFCCALNAQQISVPYECGFEDAAEVGNWKLNAGPNGSKCQDQWMVGNLDNNGGFNSMYISCDTGKTTTYGAKPNVVIAYRKIETNSSNSVVVDCSFDWKCVGAKGISELKFYMLPANFFASESELASTHTSATLPNTLRSMPPAATLSGSDSWQYWSSSINGNTFTLSPGEEWYMIFIWENKNKTVSKEALYAACVDNVQLSFTDCWKPENLQVESMCDTIKVFWEGYNDSFEFEYKKADARIWSGKTITKATSMVLSGLGEGLYSIRVRGLCGDMKSAWVTCNEAVCYCPDRHCINFVTLDGDGVICEVGDAIDLTTKRFNLTASLTGPVEGRHTAMWKQNEFDPNTGNNLRTIPLGSLASVRLGDNKSGGLAEGLKYEYLVDTLEAKIILMKYAVVLQKPGHGPSQDPGFVLEILDQNGQKIDPSCGVFDFTPEKGDFWNKHNNYVWKDWTDIGLNLEKYHGQKIYIHLVTQDCTPKAHTGYAYFTLDCIDAAIKNNSCGETATIEMEAPIGFEYIWTNESDRNKVISREQKIKVPSNDITTYYCEVRYKGLPNCGFELHTKVIPRFAHASFDWEHKPENCENKVFFTNKSCVATRVNGVDTLTSEPCEAFEWRISNGEETSFENWSYTFPSEGGIFDVTLNSYISGGACYDDTTITIVVPSIHEHHDTIYESFCEGDYIEFDNKIIANSGEYVESKKNVWGCDSITVLYLDVIPEIADTYITDTICEGDEYIFCGKSIVETGQYKEKLLSVHGCDSVVYLDIVVSETLKLEFDALVSTCSGDPTMILPYQQLAGSSFDSCDVRIDFGGNQYSTVAAVDALDRIITFSMPENPTPGYYDLILDFGKRSCGDSEKLISLSVYYSKDLIAQRWGDVLAVKNADYNGGYEFSAFQWYKNGTPIDGATSSVYYAQGGLDLTAEYSVLLTRVSDGASVMTCVVDLEDYSNFEGSIVVVFKANDNVAVEATNNARLYIWSLQGFLVSEVNINEGYNLIDRLGLSGVYLFEFVFDDGSREIKQVVL